MEGSPVTQEIQNNFIEAARLLKSARCLTAFTGAGISSESGVPSFRGEGGLWSKYDPKMFELGYFYKYPEKVWAIPKEMFYESIASAKPNEAHYVLARLEAPGALPFIEKEIEQSRDTLLSKH